MFGSILRHTVGRRSIGMSSATLASSSLASTSSRIGLAHVRIRPTALLPPPSSPFHTSAPCSVRPRTWGGGKLKSHQGTRKRFRAVPPPRKIPRTTSLNYIKACQVIRAPTGDVIGLRPAPPKPLVRFKGAHSHRNHNNSKKTHDQKARLRATKLYNGANARLIQKLMGPRGGN